jgi:hypothetical protein
MSSEYKIYVETRLRETRPNAVWGILLSGSRGFNIVADTTNGIKLHIYDERGGLIKSRHYSLPAGNERNIGALSAAFDAARAEARNEGAL